ncbi:MAG TPA: DDE-type integrase/transposase/recombinase [Anaerolineae bacterium]|nr:DDE-type integrase/transposase/recombinase [Anaerolineae bacterium]
MDKEMQERIALFRFGLISSLVSHKGLSRGEQEQRIRQITSRTWQIPGSPRSSIARTTLLRWLAVYQQSGCQVESLKPHPRADRGCSRVMDGETEGALVALRREMPAVSLPVLVKMARSRRIIPADRTPSKDSLYRLFRRHGLDKDLRLPTDRRRFETELVNDLWQSDCMHGPRVIHEGKLRKSFLFAIIDDHSRLIPHAQFYLAENLESFRDCLLQALEKRGLPRRLYADNGSSFRSNRLKYACARLGVALLHSAPYTPEGRGKIERFFRTVRMQLIPLLAENLSLEKLNEQLHAWIDGDYHQRIHSTTGQTPLERYLAHLSLLRSAPKDVHDYFRVVVRRKVDKDRTVTLNGKLFEAPVGLIGKYVMLLYHPHDPLRIEVLLEEQPQGFLIPLNGGVNSRVRRVARQSSELVAPQGAPVSPPYRGGSLFRKGSSS